MNSDLNQLTRQIETSLGKELQTPKDFDLLHEKIFARLGIMLSATTLKRLWGYLPGKVEPRISTLNILARFIGYSGWEDFCHRCRSDKPMESNPVMNRKINVATDLHPGSLIRLTWMPDRVCDIRYKGNMEFEVLNSLNTRLKAGDTFRCSLFIENEPLYLDHLVQGGAPKEATAYVCGKISGIRFEKIG